MPVTIKSTGGGSVTLTAPNTASDYTATLPASNNTLIAVAPGSSGNVLTSDGTNWTSAAPTSTGINVQTFTSSGTWTKPSLAAGSRVLIQAWGGGGSGGKASGSSSNAGGAGGGGYNERWVTLSTMGATETITIGAGGNALSAGGNGNNGGNTTVGSLLTAYGGGGGGGGTSASNTYYNGCGGGLLSAGTVGGSSSSPGLPYYVCDGPNGYYQGQGGRANGGAGYRTADTYQHGGGGGYAVTNGFADNSVWGGGGGGASVTATAGGTSLFGGAGGAGGSTGTAGTQPGGGGGGSTSGNSGAGGAGQVIITVFPA